MDVAQVDDLFGSQDAADHADQHVADIVDEVHHRHHDARHELRLPARLAESRITSYNVCYTKLLR